MSPIDPIGAAPQGADAAAAAMRSADSPEEIKEAARQFESMFLSKLISEMFESAGVGKDLPDGYLTMMEEKFSDYMTQAGGFGLQAVLTSQMSGGVTGSAVSGQGQDGATTAPSGVDTDVPASAPPAPPTSP